MFSHRNPIVKYISYYKRYTSRYEIDKALLKQGCSPQEIEEAWQIVTELSIGYKWRKSTIVLFAVIWIIWLFSWTYTYFYPLVFLPVEFGVILGGLCPLLFLAIFWYLRIRPSKTAPLAVKILIIPVFLAIVGFFLLVKTLYSFSHFTPVQSLTTERATYHLVISDERCITECSSEVRLYSCEALKSFCLAVYTENSSSYRWRGEDGKADLLLFEHKGKVSLIFIDYGIYTSP